MTCDHNEMVSTNDPNHGWKCAKCGYVYGKTWEPASNEPREGRPIAKAEGEKS